MIVGVGVDLVDLTRFEHKLIETPSLVEKIFSVTERDAKHQSLAGIWAAKEAVIKALGNSVGLAWHDVEVSKDEFGKPFLNISGATKERAESMGINSWHLSISHDGGMAMAFVIAEGAN
jgi:holo-[acyl-carrier protein] synthase